MTHKPQFISDLKLGQAYEKEYIKLRGFNNVEHHTDKMFKEYDFKNLDTDYTYEVKADRRTHQTNNIYIEFESRNKPSGIMKTTSDYWVHFICCSDYEKSNEYIQIKTEKLRQIIEENNFQIRSGGDKNTSQGYLIPRNILKKYLKNCDINIKERRESPRALRLSCDINIKKTH